MCDLFLFLPFFFSKDRGLFDSLIPESMSRDFTHFQELEMLDISFVSRVTYTACHKLLQSKKPLKLVHTSVPMFLCGDKVSPDIAVISEDCKEIEFRSHQQAHMVRANAVIPSELAVFYFEIEVINSGHDGSIGIGIASRGHSLQGMPGWYSGSYGFHGDDGAIFSGDKIGEGRSWGPEWSKKGTVVGLGVQRNKAGKMQVFFTRNGKLLGIAFDNIIEDYYYPVVGALSANSVVRCKFHPNEWRFDLDNESKMRKGDFSNEPNILLDASSTDEEEESMGRQFYQAIFGSK